jgi:hypothetical protein
MEDSDMWGNMRHAREYIIRIPYSDSNWTPGMGHFDFMKMTKILEKID